MLPRTSHYFAHVRHVSTNGRSSVCNVSLLDAAYLPILRIEGLVQVTDSTDTEANGAEGDGSSLEGALYTEAWALVAGGCDVPIWAGRQVLLLGAAARSH